MTDCMHVQTLRGPTVIRRLTLRGLMIEEMAHILIELKENQPFPVDACNMA